MGQWDVILGPILIASWINSALFAIEYAPHTPVNIVISQLY